MASNSDSAASCPYAAASEHRPSMPLTIMDLPDDAVEEIVRRAEDSVCNLTLAHPRFAEILSQMRRPRIKATHICESLQRSMTHICWSVRVLTLMNCHSESSLIQSLVLKCPNLTELNTVNSGLETDDLIPSIKFLSKLETLSFSAIKTAYEYRDTLFPEHGSLRSIYVEYSPCSFIFVLNLINSCIKIERLHLVEVPNAGLNNFPWLRVLMNFFGEGKYNHASISRQRWQTLHTVILAKVGNVHRRGHFRLVFENRPASLDVTLADFCLETDIVYHRGIFNVMTPRERNADYESGVLNRMYVVRSEHPVWHYGQPRLLRIEDPRAWSLRGSLPQSILSLTTLVELDLIKCCSSDNRPEIWYPLFQSSAGLESLILPLCLLTTRSFDTYGNDAFPFVEALEKLKLKKLHCSRAGHSRWCGCHNDLQLPYLTGLAHLEELTLMNPPVKKDFLNRIAIRSMSCLRIYKRDYGRLNLPKLKMFMATCKNLRYLKVDWSLLPLHEELLWRRLSRANLKRLCIKSSTEKPVDLRMVREFLPGICQGLDVFHIDALELDNAKEFNSLLEADIDKINLARKHNPIQATLPTSPPCNIYPGHDIFANSRGRALCCVQDRRHELTGWIND